MLRVQQEYTVYAVTVVYYERIVKTWSEYSHKECDATVSFWEYFAPFCWGYSNLLYSVGLIIRVHILAIVLSTWY